MNVPLQPEITVHMPQHVFEQIKAVEYEEGYTKGYHDGWDAAQKERSLWPQLPEKSSDEQYATYKEKVDGTEGPTHS